MRVIIRRKLNDYARWKPIVSEMDGTRKQHGSKGATVYRSARDPNEVFLVFDWDDTKDYHTYFDLPEVQKALADTGTTEVIEISEAFTLDE